MIAANEEGPSPAGWEPSVRWPGFRGSSRSCAARPRTLLVASTGGHLAELVRLESAIETIGEPLWVTFPSEQSRSLLRGREVVYVRDTAPRDVANVVRNLPAARTLLRQHDVCEVISTGSAVALSFLPLARARGASCHYIESAARTVGPSLTGRTLQRLGGIQLYTQHPAWVGGGWELGPSVFDAFAPGPTSAATPKPLSVFVTLGTLPFRFERLVDAVRSAIRPDWKVTWQVGENSYPELPGRVVGLVGSQEFSELCASADVVIGHAGVGTALSALDSGRHPLLVARRRSDGEHIDDHQRFIAERLSAAGVATALEPAALDTDAIERAAQCSVVEQIAGTRIRLSSSPVHA